MNRNTPSRCDFCAAASQPDNSHLIVRSPYFAENPEMNSAAAATGSVVLARGASSLAKRHRDLCTGPGKIRRDATAVNENAHRTTRKAMWKGNPMRLNGKGRGLCTSTS